MSRKNQIVTIAINTIKDEIYKKALQNYIIELEENSVTKLKLKNGTANQQINTLYMLLSKLSYNLVTNIEETDTFGTNSIINLVSSINIITSTILSASIKNKSQVFELLTMCLQELYEKNLNLIIEEVDNND